MNDYFEEFSELQEKGSFRGQQWFGERQRLVEKYGWAIPNDEAIEYLSQFTYLLSIGAGAAYWEHLIEKSGGKVGAYDEDPPKKTYMHVYEESAWDMSVEGEPVLLIWPPTDNEMAERVARDRPSHILYVGEPNGGCTATDRFFSELSGNYFLQKTIDIPSYAGVNDRLFHYIRRT